MSESIWDDPRITRYVLGEMSEQDRLDFEIEIESNSELASAIDEARTVTDQLVSLYREEAVPLLDDARRTAIVGGGPALSEGGASTGWTRIGLVLAIAATLLLITSASLYQVNQRTLVKHREEQALNEALVQRQAVAQNTMAESLRSNSLSSEIAPSLGIEAEASRAATRYSIATDGLVEGTNRIEGFDSAGLGVPSGPGSVEFVKEEGRPIILSGSADDLARVRNRVGQTPVWIEQKSAERESTPPADTTQVLLNKGRALQEQESFAMDDGATLHPGNPVPGNPVVEVAEAKTATLLGFGLEPSVESAGKGLELAKRLSGRTINEGILPTDQGLGPGMSGDRFEPITDNPFQRVADHPLSTLSVDVDTASYSKVRDYLMRGNQLPRPDSVRIEEMLNYFSYQYEPPANSAEHPFAARVSVTSCPWNEQHRLARIALQGKTMASEDRPPCNLVFLLDTSGSMNRPNKLPLVIEGMQLLLKQLNDDDRVAITVYAGSAGMVLDSTAAKKEKKIRKALTQLSAGGSTNGGAGIALAYQTAREHFVAEGVNRVILCTDGDFNVGTTSTDELVRMVEQEAKGGVFLTVLGFGMGNHNDAMLEQISGRGNGNYAFIDSPQEAHKVLVEQVNGTLVTIAKDVKLQIEFNPTHVASYRLIGYENRVLAKEDFNDDKKDAAEIGAGHSVTALYEIVPAGSEVDANPPKVDDLKYQQPPVPSEAAESEEMATLKLRYKTPDSDVSTPWEFPVVDEGGQFAEADDDVRFAAAVASFGMQLRRSPYAGSWTLSDAMNVANRAKGEDRDGLRAEFITLIQKASELMGEE